MKSLPPESDNDFPEEAAASRTDLASLSATPVTERLRKKKGPATDFRSLRASLGAPQRVYRHRTALDYMMEVITPILIFFMAYSIMFFMLDVYHLLHPELSQEDKMKILRLVTFCFLLGIVALNRLIAVEGSEESMIYTVGLGGAVALYTFSTPDLYGIAAFFNNNPYAATLFNVILVAFIWWSVNRLVHECCVDDRAESANVGLLTSTARKIQSAISTDPKARDKRPDSYLYRHEYEAYDPHDWKKPEPKKAEAIAPVQRLSRRHPGISVLIFSVPSMAIFALGLPVLRQGGHAMVLTGDKYVIMYTFCALLLLLLTSLAGLREYFRRRRIALPERLAPFWGVLGAIMVVIVLIGAAWLPSPKMPRILQTTAHQKEYWSVWYRDPNLFVEVKDEDNPMDQLQDFKVMQAAGMVVMAAFALFSIYGLIRLAGFYAAELGQRRYEMPLFVRRFFNWLDRFLLKITQIPVLPSRSGHLRISREFATCMKYSNPLGNMDKRQSLGSAGLIEYAYQALCALAYDAGVPRSEGQTPYEFIAAFPKPLANLRQEAIILTDLYVISAYSGLALPENFEDRLRRFWLVYDRVRRRIVR